MAKNRRACLPGVLKALRQMRKLIVNQFEDEKGCHRTFQENLSWRELVITPSGQKSVSS